MASGGLGQDSSQYPSCFKYKQKIQIKVKNWLLCIIHNTLNK